MNEKELEFVKNIEQTCRNYVIRDLKVIPLNIEDVKKLTRLIRKLEKYEDLYVKTITAHAIDEINAMTDAEKDSIHAP